VRFEGPLIAPPRRSWTPEEFYVLRDAAPATLRHELVDGDLLVTSAPSRSHQSIIAKFVMEVGPYVRAQRLGELLPAPFDVKLARSVVL
jgi:Uma2 family endonuclease